MSVAKTVESGRQPLVGEFGRRRQAQAPRFAGSPETPQAVREVAQSAIDFRQELAPERRQFDMPLVAREQLSADPFFQLRNLMADRGLGQAELVRGPAETALPGHRQEGAQRLQGREGFQGHEQIS